MKALIVGSGKIGSVAAADLSEKMPSVEVVVSDKDEKRAKAVAERLGTKNISAVPIDASSHDQLVRDLEPFDIILGFLPGNLGYRLMQACIDTGKDLVDVSFMAENPLTLNEKAVKAGVTIIPDCGLAPGMSNLLVGHATSELDSTKTVEMMVGGLPEKPVPPLEYVITWSPESLVDEYTRKARIIRHGEMIEVESLTGVESIDFPGVGQLEAFFTDGLRTLMYTVEADEMWEKTLRYLGHSVKIKMLDALGFFDETPISIDGIIVSPRKVTAMLLGKALSKPEVRDFVALKVKVTGIKDGSAKTYNYVMSDRFDEKGKVTSMARTTAYPASIASQMLLQDKIDEKGMVPPERIGMNRDAFGMFRKELEARRIKISEQVT
jgi:lysine 6-dehydrogenase